MQCRHDYVPYNVDIVVLSLSLMIVLSILCPTALARPTDKIGTLSPAADSQDGDNRYGEFDICVTGLILLCC